jgi:hypothetical protein
MADEDAAALAIKTGIEQLLAPLHDFLGKLLGPAATEVGLSVGDSARVWRMKRQLRLLQELKAMIDASGLDIKPIAPRLFFPILEAASVEDDDDMQSRWAALLANAATTNSVHPSFIEVLRNLAPDEARLLDKLYDACKLKNTSRVRPWVDSISIAEQTRRRSAGENPEDAFANLVRLGLIQASYEMIDRPTALKIVGGHPQIIGRSELKEESELSEIAFKFVRACRAPNLKAG